MFLYNLLYIIYSKKPIFLALECLFRGDRGNAVWGLFCIFAEYKLAFVTLQTKTAASRMSASHRGGSLQRQFRSGSRIRPWQERSRGDLGRSQKWLLYFLHPKSSPRLPKGLDQNKPSLCFSVTAVPSARGGAPGKVETWGERSQTVLKLDLKLSGTGFFTFPSL